MYDAFSEDYDRFVNWESRLASEMPFIERLLQPLEKDGQPVRVLDAACGTGMHAIELAQRGYQTAGADLSVKMVEHARVNAGWAGVEVPFQAAGFGSLSAAFGKSAFDALLCLGNSLPHLLTPTELVAALEDFAECLRPGGLLIIQNRNFDAVVDQQERWMEPQSFSVGDREWLFLRFYDFLADGLINFNIVTLQRYGNEAWSQRVNSTLLYPLREAETLQALHAAGFQRVDEYGGLNGAPFEAQSSGNLVTVSLK